MAMAKGDATRSRILDRAFRLAGREGLDRLSIGTLAGELGLSKSGLFAHFGSKQDLEVAVLERAAQEFEANVVKPGLRAPKGAPRLRKLFELWLRWVADPTLPGGCLFVAAATELDDREGPAREFLVEAQKSLQELLAEAARRAIEQGHFRRGLDCRRFAFELYAIVLGFNHAFRLMRDPQAENYARAAFERLLADAAA